MLSLNAQLLKRLVIVSIVLVVVTGSFCNFMIYQVVQDPDANISKVLFRFDLGHEPSLPNFFSSCLILLAAAQCWLAAKISESRAGQVAWKFSGTILILLAIDETIMIHEMLNKAMTVLGLGQIPVVFPWTIAGLVFVGITGWVARPILSELSRRHRIRVITAGTIFLAGAVGLENVAALIFYLEGGEAAGVTTLAHWAAQTIEESLEFSGMGLFTLTVFDHILDHKKQFQMQVKT